MPGAAAIPRIRIAWRQGLSGLLPRSARVDLPPVVVRAAYRLLHRSIPLEYSSADPLKLVYVHPAEIVRFASYPPRFEDERITIDVRYRVHKWANLGRVVGGDWDRDIAELDLESGIHGALWAHFTRGVPWEDTAFIGELLSAVQDGRADWHGCRTAEDVLRRCREIDALHASIAATGYLPRPRHGPFSWKHRLDEIVVNIGRDGQLIHNSGGNHRLIIARVLAVTRVPVRILLRHSGWEAIRREVSLSRDVGTLSEPARMHLGHPDLRDCGVAAQPHAKPGRAHAQ